MANDAGGTVINFHPKRQPFRPRVARKSIEIVENDLPTPPFTTSVAFYQANAEAFIVASVRDIGKREATRIAMEILRGIARQP